MKPKEVLEVVESILKGLKEGEEIESLEIKIHEDADGNGCYSIPKSEFSLTKKRT